MQKNLFPTRQEELFQKAIEKCESIMGRKPDIPEHLSDSSYDNIINRYLELELNGFSPEMDKTYAQIVMNLLASPTNKR